MESVWWRVCARHFVRTHARTHKWRGELILTVATNAAAMNPLLAMTMQQGAGAGLLAGAAVGAGIATAEQTPTPVLMLTNMVTLSDLEDATVVEEIKEDTVEECSKCGGVEVRPGLGSNACTHSQARTRAHTHTRTHVCACVSGATNRN